jgi:hypothetical protein
LHRDVWAVVPIKEIVFAKQRLAKALSPARRQELALAMFEDVMQALSASHDLAGIAVVTLDQSATQIAARWGAEVWTDGARGGHAGAVTAAARRLAATGSTMLTDYSGRRAGCVATRHCRDLGCAPAPARIHDSSSVERPRLQWHHVLSP